MLAVPIAYINYFTDTGRNGSPVTRRRQGPLPPIPGNPAGTQNRASKYNCVYLAIVSTCGCSPWPDCEDSKVVARWRPSGVSLECKGHDNTVARDDYNEGYPQNGGN